MPKQAPIQILQSANNVFVSFSLTKCPKIANPINDSTSIKNITNGASDVVRTTGSIKNTISTIAKRSQNTKKIVTMKKKDADKYMNED